MPLKYTGGPGELSHTEVPRAFLLSVSPSTLISLVIYSHLWLRWKLSSPEFLANKWFCCCSVAKWCPSLCDPMEGSMPGLPSFTISRSLLKFMSDERVQLFMYCMTWICLFLKVQCILLLCIRSTLSIYLLMRSWLWVNKLNCVPHWLGPVNRTELG